MRRRRDFKHFLNQFSQILPNLNLQHQSAAIQLLHFQVFAHSSTTKCTFSTTKTPFSKLNNKPLCTNQIHTQSDENPNSFSCSGDEFNKLHEDLSSTSRSDIARSVISRCSHLWEKTDETLAQVSLKDLLLKLSYISPKSTRRFWGISHLNPEDVHEILLGFEFDRGKVDIEARKVGNLWNLFKWVSQQSENFEHLPQSCEIMVSMLTRVGLFCEAQSLLRNMEARGNLLGSQDIFSKMIEGYASARDLENSVFMYNWMRSRGFIPLESCFPVLLKLLLENRKTWWTFRVYMDMIEIGFGLSIESVSLCESVVKLLCKKGKVKEARSIIRKLVASGLEPNRVVVNLIANGYSEKKDFYDLLNFLKERKCAPDAPICNRILTSQCRNFGSEQAYIFMIEMESLGFKPDEVTFGTLISWSCREGKLKDAFMYFSELLSRCLRPDINSYNALISGVFKKGMWKHASEIFDEMLERGTTPDLSTFKVLLAGYCKFRRFDEAKGIILEMVKQNLVQVSPSEDPLSKAFSILGFEPSAVKVKRDNDAGSRKAEFFDTLGNGLYLETDVEKYEKMILGILDGAMVVDCNSLIIKECDYGRIKTALAIKDTMICRGQKLTLSAYSALLKGLCLSRKYFSKAIFLYEEMPEMVYQLDEEILNLFIRVTNKKGVPHKGKIILEGMLRRNLPIENETYTTLITSICKKGCEKELHKCWEIAQNHEWLPSLKDYKAILDCLCQKGMIKEILELLERTLMSSIHSISDIGSIFLEVLCGKGHASVGRIFSEEVVRQRGVLDYAAYNHLISGLCKEKNYQEALGILDTMLEKEMTPCMEVYAQIIPQLCRSRRLEKVMTLKEIMLRQEQVSCFSVYYALLNGLYRGGKIAKADLEFQDMISKGISPDTDTYNLMIEVYCQANNPRRVGELLSIMIRNNFGLSISSYRNVVRIMCMHGRMLHVLSLKEILLRERQYPFIVVYNILIFQLLQTGKSSLVIVLLDEMRRKGLVLDEFSYSFLLCGYIKCEDVSKSLEVLKSMIDSNLRPSRRSLAMVVKHLCDHKILNKALELSRVMELRGWVHGSVVQNAIVEGLLSHGRVQEAENYLRRIDDRNLIPNSISYDSAIKKFCQHGRLDIAVDLLDIMLKKGSLPGPSCYDSIIQSFCDCKAVDDALYIHTEMLARDLKPSIKSWDVLIHGLCTHGRAIESERLLDSIIKLGQRPTPSMYQNVIDRYSLENNHNKASALLHKMQEQGYVPDFKTHWSLISNLSNSNKDNTESGGFLSKLLSLSGFTGKKDPKVA